MITSPNNDRIKAARKLHSRQHRRRTGSFLIEGVRLIRDAVQSGYYPETVYYVRELDSAGGGQGEPQSESQGEIETELQQLVALLQAKGVECTPVSSPVLASMSQTVTPQGIVAVARVPDLPLSTHSALALVLDGVSDPGNAGTLLRSAEAAGAGAAIFGPDAVDPFNDKVVRAGMGAHFRMPLRACATWPEVKSTLKTIMGGDAPIYAADAGASLAYDAIDWTIPAVLVIGSEATGISDAARAVATPISIPMYGPVESLNAAMAGVVILFEAARQRRNYVQASVDTSESYGVS